MIPLEVLMLALITFALLIVKSYHLPLMANFRTIDRLAAESSLAACFAFTFPATT